MSLSVGDVTLPRGGGDWRKESRGPRAPVLVRKFHILLLKTLSPRFQGTRHLPCIAGSPFLTSCALLLAEWSSFLLGETPAWVWALRSWVGAQPPLLPGCVTWENYLTSLGLSGFSSAGWQ